MLLAPALPVNAEDCELYLEQAKKFLSDYNKALKVCEDWEKLIEKRNEEILEAEKFKLKCENELKECSDYIKGDYDRDIKALKNEIIRREEQLVGENIDVDLLQQQLNCANSAIQQWAAAQGLPGVFAGQGAQVSALGIASRFVSKFVTKGVLGPIGCAADVIGIGLTVTDSLHFNRLVITAKMAQLRLTDALEKKLETEEAIASKQREINEKEAYIKAGLPNSCKLYRDPLEAAEARLKSLQHGLMELTGTLARLKQEAAGLYYHYESARAAYEYCKRATESTPTPPPTPTPTPSASNWTLYIQVGEGCGGVEPVLPQTGMTCSHGQQVTIKAWNRENCGKFSHWDIQKLDANGNIIDTEDIWPSEQTQPTIHTITVTSDVSVIAHFKER